MNTNRDYLFNVIDLWLAPIFKVIKIVKAKNNFIPFPAKYGTKLEGQAESTDLLRNHPNFPVISSSFDTYEFNKMETVVMATE